MNYMLRNNITLIGNITKIGDIFTTKTENKMQFFDIGQGNKYINDKGEEVSNSQYFTIRLNENLIGKYEFLEIGKPVHVTGYLKSYINKNNIREVIVIPTTIRDLSNTKENAPVEVFDYDWLNEDNSEEVVLNGI